MSDGNMDQEARGVATGEIGDLATIRWTTTESLGLLRSLVDLLLPRQSANSGQELGELVRAMVAQQREMFIAVKEMQATLDSLVEHLDGGPTVRANGRFNGVGRA